MWPNPQETADLVTFTEEILTGKLHFLCSDYFHYLPPKSSDYYSRAKLRQTFHQLWQNAVKLRLAKHLYLYISF